MTELARLREVQVTFERVLRVWVDAAEVSEESSRASTALANVDLDELPRAPRTGGDSHGLPAPLARVTWGRAAREVMIADWVSSELAIRIRWADEVIVRRQLAGPPRLGDVVDAVELAADTLGTAIDWSQARAESSAYAGFVPYFAKRCGGACE
jgi:hypothetical protein